MRSNEFKKVKDRRKKGRRDPALEHEGCTTQEDKLDAFEEESKSVDSEVQDDYFFTTTPYLVPHGFVGRLQFLFLPFTPFQMITGVIYRRCAWRKHFVSRIPQELSSTVVSCSI